tara:strand:- start:156 stop:413 length:258 start_codon:yes stop_codon:yes gene_type:complete
MIKYVLILQICSMVTGQCFPPLSDSKVLDSWSKCIEKGMERTMLLINQDREAFDNYQYVVRLYCKKNEDNSNESPASSKSIEKAV